MSTLDNGNNNIINVARNSVGRRRVFIDVKTNPCMVYLNTDIPGLAVNAQIRKTSVDTGAATYPYVQLDFGGAMHTETNITYGAKCGCFQVSAGQGESIKVPVRFLSDHIPQNFKLSIYGPGEPADLVTLGPLGAQVYIQYEFIAN